MGKQNVLIQGCFEDPKPLRDWITDCPKTMPVALRPTTYGHHEVPSKRNSKPIADYKVFSQEAQQTEFGLFLHGKNAVVHWTHGEGTLWSECQLWFKSKLWFESACIADAASYCEQLLSEWSDIDCYYAFGAHWSEYRARNGYEYAVGDKGGKREGWAGRNYTKYVPGLYWLNYFSRQYIETMKIDYNIIANELSSRVHSLRAGVVLCLYHKPTDWIDKNESVRGFLRTNKQFFNIEDVPTPGRILTSKESLEWSSKIFQEWR